MRYLASSRESVSRLAMNLSTVRSVKERAAILAVLDELRLFRSPWLLRTGARVLARVRGGSPTKWQAAALERVGGQSPAALADMWEQLIRHCLRGHDREDDDSVGGWSQRELDLLASRVTFHADKELEHGMD